MTRKEIEDRLRGLMKTASPVQQVDWNSVTGQSEIAALGFDSLSILDLIYDVQQAFGLQFDAEEMTGIVTVADLVTFLDKKLSSAGQAS
jgi:acyl carrier protein